MKIEEGKMIYEVIPCYSCEGKGSRDYNTLCPRMHKPVTALPGRVCDYCGSKNRHNHRTIGKEHRVCDTCRGTGTEQETAYSHMSANLWQSLPFRVHRMQREMSVREDLLGLGLGTTVDYGRHKVLSDDALIAKVKEDFKGGQPINGVVSRADHSRVCDYVAIVTSDTGYSLIGVFQKAAV